MNNHTIKDSIIKKCIETLEEKAKIAKDAMDEAQQSANEYGQPKDRYDSFRMQVLRKRDMFAEQLQKLLDDVQILKRIKTDNLHESIMYGSIVFLDKYNLFISIALGKVTIDEGSFQVISDKTPIFEAIRGLKKDNSFIFNGNQIHILDVF